MCELLSICFKRFLIFIGYEKRNHVAIVLLFKQAEPIKVREVSTVTVEAFCTQYPPGYLAVVATLRSEATRSHATEDHGDVVAAKKTTHYIRMSVQPIYEIFTSF